MNVLDFYTAHCGQPKSKGSGSRGKELCGPCPGCGGKDRFIIWPDKGEHGEYMCRKCDCAGDGPQFLMDFEGLTFPQACERLGMKLDPKAPSTPRLPAAARREAFEPRRVDNPSEIWAEKALAFTDHCHAALLSTPDQLDWLASRGITRESVERFRLGWNAKDVYRPRQAWGLPEKLKDAGTPVKLWLPQGHTIPFFVDGRFRRVRIRKWEVRDTDDPRYYVVPSTTSSAGMDTWISREGAEFYVVVESELDGVLLAQEAGDLSGVIALGSAKTKPDARAAKSLAQAKLILVATDFDAAGAEAFWSAPKNDPGAGGWWPRNFPRAVRWMVPEGKDPGDYVKDYGGCVRDWVLAGLPPSVTVGLSRFGGEVSGEARAKEEACAAWRAFAARRGGSVRLVRYLVDGEPCLDLDYSPDPSGGDPTVGANDALEACGGWDAALDAGLVEDVEYGALWRGW